MKTWSQSERQERERMRENDEFDCHRSHLFIQKSYHLFVTTDV